MWIRVMCAVALASVMRDARLASPPRDSYVFGGRIIAADSGALDGVHVVAIDARGPLRSR